MPISANTIFTVNALTSSGKTYNAMRVAHAGTRAGEKYLYAVPTTDLATQVEKDCRAIGGMAVSAIHTADGHSGAVLARLNAHFQNTPANRGEILIMTMAALERLIYIERRGTWNLIVDEVPNIVFHDPVCLHENRHHLLDLFSEQPWNASYTMVSASEVDTGRVMDVARNRFGDEITQRVADIANKLLSQHWQGFVLNDQLARFKAPGDAKRVLDVFALLQPSIFAGFKSVTLMGACLDETVLYRHWLSQGISFVPHPTIRPNFTRYANGGLVTVQYAIDRDWSARLRDQAGVFDNIIGRCKRALHGEPYVYLANKGQTLPSLADGTRLPHVSHGLNDFAGFHNAMLLSALNPPPSYFGFCNDMLGLDGDELRAAIYRTATYQAASRIIRNAADTHPKRIQVVDKSTAIWIGHLIANSKTEKLPGLDPASDDRRRVAKPKTNAEMLVSFRHNAKQKLLAELDSINGFNDIDQKTQRKDMLYTKGYAFSELPHVGSIFLDKFAKLGLDTNALSVAAFRTLLGELHRRVIEQKDFNQLACSCLFDPALDRDTSRGNANIISMSGLWLDNDGGDLSPADFAAMLKVPMVIYNSFSSTVTNPRWRVWLPTAHLITPAVHKDLVAQIKKMLINHQYYGQRYIAKHPDRPVKHHGFDEPKLTQAVLFYLPCRAKAGAKASFFDEHHWDKPLLNPYQWIDRTISDIGRRPSHTPRSPRQTPRKRSMMRRSS